VDAILLHCHDGAGQERVTKLFDSVESH
jgi:hypothetical protein